MNKQKLINRIIELKKEKNAIILAHYYQNDEVQDIADFIGDSLLLSKVAKDTDAQTIVFCGVHFMAETAKILSPNKTVLLPVISAGCPMADMANSKDLAEYKKANPDRVIVCYVNSTAKVKALSDICVTSSNAEKIIKQYKDKKIMYVPDKNLGLYLKDKYNLDLEVWPGYCDIHNNVNIKQVNEAKEKYPNAELIVHPEVPLNIVKIADYAGSTKGLCDYVQNSNHNEFIIGTECGVIHQMKILCPNKKFHILTPNLNCKDMKLTTLNDVYNSLLNNEFEIKMDEKIRIKAYNAIDKMLKMS